MIDNFKQIRELLSFNNPNWFYFVQIIQRRKEVEDLGSNNRTIKTYYIDSLEHFDKRKEEIIGLCNYFNARAYIHLNPRNWHQICLQSIKHNAELIISEQFKGIKSQLNTVIGQYGATGWRKTWIVDIDIKDEAFIQELIHKINQRQPVDITNKIIARLETKNGCHLITYPFDTRNWDNSVEIHKNNPTNLIIP